MRFRLPRVLTAGPKVRSELHAGALHHLLRHRLGLCLINNVCNQGMNRGRREGREGDRE